MQLKKYDIPPPKDTDHPSCHRCGEHATYGYEMNKDRTKYIGPVCNRCALYCID